MDLTGSNYRPEIDGLRALAVLSVILYHAGLSLFSGGYIGVDVFFVISGFLITTIILNDLDRNVFSLAKFYERRLRRILPPLFFMAMAVCVFGWFYFLPGEFVDFGRSLRYMAFCLANVLFYRQAGYFDSLAESKPLLHTWSLSVEEQFYLFLPLLLMLLSKKGRRVLIPVLGCLAVVSFLLCLKDIEKKQSAVFYLLHYRAWELLAGSLLAFVPQQKLSLLKYPNLIALAALLLILLPATLYTKATMFPGLAALPVILGAMLVIFLGSQGFVGKILAMPPFTAIGKISYALYLWHWPLLVLPAMVNARPLRLNEIIVSMGATFALSIFSYFVIEKPIRSRRLLPTRKLIFSCSMIAISLMAISGHLLKAKAGFPDRLPAAAAVANFENDYHTFKQASAECLKVDTAKLDSKGLSPCVFMARNNSSPAFILFGDSHGAAWAPALTSMAEKYDISWLQYTRASCAPFVKSVDPAAPNSHPCVVFRNNILEVIKKYDIKHVCLAAAYSSYLGGRRGKATDNVAAKYMEVETFNAVWGETIDLLRKAGVKIWVVQDVPEYEAFVPYILTRAALSGADFKSVAVKQDEYERIYRPVKAAINSSLSDDVRFLPIDPPICHNGLCMPGTKNGSFYSDFQHLSVFGARYFQSTFKPMLETIRNDELKKESIDDK